MSDLCGRVSYWTRFFWYILVPFLILVPDYFNFIALSFLQISVSRMLWFFDVICGGTSIAQIHFYGLVSLLDSGYKIWFLIIMVVSPMVMAELGSFLFVIQRYGWHWGLLTFAGYGFSSETLVALSFFTSWFPMVGRGPNPSLISVFTKSRPDYIHGIGFQLSWFLKRIGFHFLMVDVVLATFLNSVLGLVQFNCLF